MAAINIARLGVLYGRTTLANVYDHPANAIVNSINSNSLVKINTVSLCNYHPNTAVVTVDIIRTTESNKRFRIAANVSVPTNATFLAVTKDSMLYLEEGDAMRLYAGANNMIEAVVSYDLIS